MNIYLSQFKYDERYDCFVAEAHVEGIYFAVLADPHMQRVQLYPVKEGYPAALVREVPGDYAYMLMDYVEEQFGWGTFNYGILPLG